MTTYRFTPDFAPLGEASFTPDHAGMEEVGFRPIAGEDAALYQDGAVIRPEQPPELDLDGLARQAFEEGYASGERAGLEVGREKATSYLDAIADTLKTATQLRAAIRREAHEELVALAVAIAERLLRRQLAVDRSLLWQRVQELVAELDDASDVTLRMNPVDLAYAESCTEDWRQLLSQLDHLRLEETRDLQQGDIRIETPTISADARITTLLQSVQERLLEAVADAIAESEG